MLRGKNKQQLHQSLGYTIIEVMIVLAVSGVMFIIAANFISGKQAKAAFNQGSNDTGSKLQKIVEDVNNGHYSDVPLQCDITGSTLTASVSGSNQQGQNPHCVFLGKIVRFYASGGNRDRYKVYPIAAVRNITSFPNDLVSAISGLEVDSAIPQALYVKDMTVVDTAGASHTNVFNIGFLQGIGNVNGDGVYQSGAQQPIQLAYANTGGGNISGTILQPAKSATICLTDGTRYAAVFIGGAIAGGNSNSNNNNQLNISVQQLGTSSC